MVPFNNISPFLKQQAKRVRGLINRTRRPTYWHNLRSLSPKSTSFGLDRGTPVDRYYIEKFIDTHHSDINGRVLEIAGATYTRKFGGTRVTHSDILHAQPGNSRATIVGDLADPKTLPAGAFDCVILTETLMCIPDMEGAIRSIYSSLKPGGVLLCTNGGISQVSRYDMDRWGDYWRLTSLGMQRIVETSFDSQQVEVTVFGNVLAATALLHGIVCEELTADELDFADDDYQVTLGARAVRTIA